MLKILNISLDAKVLEKDSAVQKRILEYSNLVQKYTVIVLGDKNDFLVLSNSFKIVSIKRGNKILGILKLKNVISQTLKKEKYNLITVQDSYFLGFLAYWMSRKYKTALEIQVHGFEKFNFFRKLIAHYVLKRADAVRVVSQRLKKQLVSDFKVQSDKITVVPIYISLDHVDQAKSTGQEFIFLTVGRLVPVKNITLQIKAIASLKDRYHNIKLWIVGDGPERKKLEKLVKKLKLQNFVKFWGWQNNLEKFYNKASVFLLTSNSEGWGMVILEAAKRALVIIMTDVGCAGDFIKNNENGIIIPIREQKILERKMEELIQNKELRSKLKKNVKDSIKNLLSKKEILNLYKESWEKAIKN